MIKGFYMYFCAIHCDYFVFIWSWIYIKLLYVVIPRPRDNPAGFNIQMLLWPVKKYWGNFYSYTNKTYFTCSSNSSSYYSDSSLFTPSLFYKTISSLLPCFLTFFFVFFSFSFLSLVVEVPLNLQSIDFNHS